MLKRGLRDEPSYGRELRSRIEARGELSLKGRSLGKKPRFGVAQFACSLISKN
jgi:hypothetical protein